MKALKRSILMGVFIMMMEVMGITAFAGWQSDEHGSWYQYDDGSYPTDRAVNFRDPNSNELIIYVFDKKGYQVKDSWYQTSEGDWYLLRPNGKAVLTYAVSGGNWYLFNNDTGKLQCASPGLGQIEWTATEYEWVNGNPGSYYDADTKSDGYFSDGVSITICRYMINTDGVITSGFNHTIGGNDIDHGYTAGRVTIDDVANSLWSMTPNEEYSFLVVGKEEVYIIETANPEHVLYHGYIDMITGTEIADLYITVGFGRSDEFALVWYDREQIDYPKLEALAKTTIEFAGDYHYIGRFD